MRLELVKTFANTFGAGIQYLTPAEDFMYTGKGWPGAEHIGYNLKYRFTEEDFITLYTPPNGLMACWESAFWQKNVCVYDFGEEGIGGDTAQSAVVHEIDTSDDNVAVHLKTGTRDANELIGGCIVEFDDDVYLLLGERAITGTGGGSWDNGGGLWKVPLATFTTDDDWDRVYETPAPNRGWLYLVYFKGKVYGSQYRLGQNSLVVRADPSDLTDWTTLDTDNTVNRRCGLDAEGELLAYSIHEADGYIHVHYSTDGITFTDINTGIATPANPNESTIFVQGKYIVLMVIDSTANTTKVYVIEPTDEIIEYLGTISGRRENTVKVGRNSLWFVVVVGTAVYWYKLIFGEETSIALTSSAESASVGNPITLTATLTKNATLLVGKTISFYRCYGAKGMSAAGNKIGTAITNGSGEASIVYTMAAAPDDKVWFRAAFDG